MALLALTSSNYLISHFQLEDKCDELVTDIKCAFDELEEIANHQFLPDWVGSSLEPVRKWLEKPH